MEATVPASGIVTPEYEFTISSPVDARIEQVMFNAGEKVNGIGSRAITLGDWREYG